MKKLTIINFSIVVLLSCVSFAYAQDYTGRTVAEVQLEGLGRVSEQLVSSQIEVQTGQEYKAGSASRDLKRLYDLGYFNTISVDASVVGGRLIITYIFQEKAFVERIYVVGNKKIKTRDIKAVLNWREGDTFIAEAYENEREAIMKEYWAKGLLNSQVDIIVEEAGSSKVNITYLIDEGTKARIKGISISGNSVLATRKLRKLMKTRPVRWLFLGGKYDEQKFEFDLHNVVEEYANHGRLEARIDSTEFSFSPKGKDLYININIVEGPEYTVETLDIAGNEAYAEDELEKIIEVRPGQVHNKGQVFKDASELQQGYEDSGYVRANVAPLVTVDKENKVTHVVQNIEEGDLKYIRQISITGNSTTRDEVIRRQLQVYPGERFDGAKLRLSQRMLENTRFFEMTRITPERIAEEDDFLDLFVDVEEGKTGNFSFGAGYSTEESVAGFAELRLNNFDITNWPKFTGGGQQFSLRTSIGTIRSQYNLSFTDPEILGYPLSFGFDLYNEEYQYTGGVRYTQKTQGLQLRFAKALSPFMRVRTSLLYQSINIQDFPWYIAPWWRRERGGSTTISSLWGISRNTLDSRLSPTKGSKHDIQLEVAGLGGDNQFLKFEHDSSWYWAPGKQDKFVFSLRTREGVVNPYGSSDFVPISDRFFVGGSNTVRGYEQYDIGPRKLRYLFFSNETDATGGELRLVTNLELSYRLTKQLRFYSFIDGGSVWETPSDFDIGDYRYGAGIGFGVEIPRMGPIRIDYGIPINPDKEQGSGRLHMSTGLRF